MNKVPVFIVPHTHWDREWYMTAEEFHFFLCEAMDEILHLLGTNEGYKFTLDGQVLPLWDFLALRPEKSTVIKEFVETRRLCIGPWFTQPDEFLVSGEALIRNLLFGKEMAEPFGGVMPHGYVPDAFGHIAQLPQILRGFGIETAFVMRGAERIAKALGTNEFLWVAPDGTGVVCHVLETGYCNGVDLDGDINKWPRSLEWLRPYRTPPSGGPVFADLAGYLAKRSQTGAALFLHGCDHRGPDALLPASVTKLAEALPQFEFLIATLEDYGNILRGLAKNLPRFTGELRQSLHHPVLPGVLSSRVYLKQTESQLEALLEKYAEPLAAFAILNGRDLWPFLRQAWQILLQNHAHDSICGTGIDEVHEAMMTRFAQARNLASSVAQEGLVKVGGSLASSGSEEASILVFNPLPWPRVAEIEVFVRDASESFLQAPDGKTVPWVIKKREEKNVFENVLHGVQIVPKRKAIFQDELPPFGLKSYRVLRGRARSDYPDIVVSSNIIENEFYKLKVRPDGIFDVWDKENNLEFRGMHLFEDVADRGDEYNFDPLPNDRAVTNQGGKARVQAKRVAPWRAELTVHMKLPLPMGLTSDRTRRSKRRVLLPIRTTLALQSRVKRVDILTKVENKAKDHRLRVVFPTGWPNSHVFVDKTFAVLNHEVVPPPPEWVVEQPTSTFPQKLFVALEQNGRGFAVINRGLPECEVTTDGKVCLTLLRAVGWLSRDDLRTRKGHAGPPLATPGAQCLGAHAFHYALYTYTGPWPSSGLLPIAQAFLVAPLAVELSSLSLSERSFFSWDREEIVLSACKPAEDGTGIIVRLYNACGERVRVHLRVGFPNKKVWLARLDETPLAPVTLHDGGVALEFGGWQIKTLKFDL